MATAVFLDAVVIRSVLMPAVLELFGSRTWAFPRWFDRRLPRLAIRRPAESRTQGLRGDGRASCDCGSLIGASPAQGLGDARGLLK